MADESSLGFLRSEPATCLFDLRSRLRLFKTSGARHVRDHRMRKLELGEWRPGWLGVGSGETDLEATHVTAEARQARVPPLAK
jgi:hypothetical protein